MALKKIALAQFPILRHASLEAALDSLTEWIEGAAQQGAEILVFPEYGSLDLLSTITQMETLSLAEQMQALQPLLKKYDAHLSQLAARLGLVIVAPSVPTQNRDDDLVNEAWVYSRRGERHVQSKYHMTRFEAESWGVVTGPSELRLFEVDGFCFGVQICFDVEFSTASALLAREGAHAIFAPSCTETMAGLHRVHVGARARALENQVYVGVSQTVGTATWCEAVDQNRGLAAFYAPPDLGFPENGILAEGKLDAIQWLVRELDTQLIDAVREHGAVFNHHNNQIDFQGTSWLAVKKISL
ncbi:MAG TPA: carbon-nitrogen hydrolase family protein [Bdellovibrionota bacterium]|jgi:predicted amidohydrolase|nr:carbon-nitrogen hydrolase family protein [Bdellovibrionota bacterium]